MKEISKNSPNESDVASNHSDSDPSNLQSTHSSQTTHKTKQIRRFSSKPDVQHLVHLQKEQRRKLTKEERFEIQRIKNKEAAQKSRDQRKVYIDVLEKNNSDLVTENTRLKQELERARKYCWRCSLELGSNSEPEKSECERECGVMEMIEEPVSLMGDTDRLELFDDKEDFERVSVMKKTHSDIFSYFFVLTVMLVVLIPGDMANEKGKITHDLPARLLMENRLQIKELPNGQLNIPPTPNNKEAPSSLSYPLVQIPPSKQLNIYEAMRLNQTETSLINYISKSSEYCIKNLAKKSETPQSLVSQKNLRESEFQNKDILFCQLPKVYKYIKENGFLSRIFDIILPADEMNRIVLGSGGISMGPFPYTGLYALTVEIRDIRKYQEAKDCLMDYL